MLRRVELKNREVLGGDSPWSIRQTAVYNRLQRKSNVCGISDKEQSSLILPECRSTFLLVSPSENVELQFAECLEQATEAEESPLSIWNTLRILISDSLRGWVEYMAYLEKRLKHQVISPLLSSSLKKRGLITNDYDLPTSLMKSSSQQLAPTKSTFLR